MTHFDFQSGNTFLHGMDVRFKLVIFIGVNLTVAQSTLMGLSGLTVFLSLTLPSLGISFKKLLIELRLFMLLLLLVFLARAVSETGEPLVSGWLGQVTLQGIQKGAVVCWRLLLIVFLGLLFIRTSRSWEIKAAIQWFLDPIPRVPAQRLSLMFSLMFRFIPMILELQADISEAQQSRLVSLRKNPLFRLKVMTVALLENTFQKVDEMTIAMESRCYSDKRTDPILISRRSDWLMLFTSAAGCLAMMFV